LAPKFCTKKRARKTLMKLTADVIFRNQNQSVSNTLSQQCPTGLPGPKKFGLKQF